MGNCPACGRETALGARFCAHCGRPLGSRCPRCNAELVADARFCTDCGAEVTVAEVAAEGELRLLTVVFCDLVGSTELSARLDPEEYSELLRSYQEDAVGVATRYGGEVDKYLGDGILFHFGWPEAHDDDPERAIRASLEIIDSVGAMNTSLPGDRHLAVRIGVHTGRVVIGEVGPTGEPELMAIGETVNLASRLQDAAEPDTVVISGPTLDLVSGIFITEDLGEHRLKGIPTPVGIHRAVQPSGVRSRLDAAGGALTPFVGREPELSMLEDRWRRAEAGSGQAVLITGEPGVGKSRLVYELRQRLADTPHSWLESRCSSYTDQSAFQPAIELMEIGLGLTADDDPGERLESLERGLLAAGVRSADAVPVLATLLAIPPGEGYGPLTMSPERRRRRTIEVLSEWVLSLAALQPLVLLVEDLHWCDPSSLELFGELVAETQGAPLMLIGTARPEFTPAWTARSNYTILAVNPFDEPEIREMVHRLSGRRELPDEVVSRIARESDGIALYAEEIGRMVLESEAVVERSGRLELAGSAAAIDIPTTLQGSLMARLDRLSSAKRVAQLASVIGREFDYELLEQVADMEPAALRGGLDSLVEGEILYRRGIPPVATYTFKHALIQDAAYQSLLKRTRRTLHERIAEALETRLGEDLRGQPGVVARHYETAERIESAVANYRLAAEQASARSGHVEAIAHLERGIALVGMLPEGPPRDALEIPLQIALGSEIMTTRSFGDPDIERVYERARQLCEQSGDPSLIAPALAGLSIYYLNCGQMDLGAELAGRVLAIGEELDDDALRLVGHNHIALPAFVQGRFGEALDHARHTIDIYNPALHHEIASRLGTDQGVVAHCFAGQALVGLGLIDQALTAMQDAVALARRLDHQFSLAYALLFETTVRWLHGDLEMQRSTASEILQISDRCGFELWTGLGHVYRAAADAVETGSAEVIPELLEGSAGAAASGNLAASPPILACVAEAQLAAGDAEGARGMAEAALTLSERTDQPWWDADLMRLKGLATARADGGGAERQIERALAVARDREMPVLELRAAIDLARLAAERGEADAASDVLAGAYDGMQEGHGTPLLETARELLAELGVERPAGVAPAADQAEANPLSG